LVTPKIKPGTAKPEQIATVLEQEIRTGRLGFGDRLQSENELVQRFAVSRNTVRKGLEELSSRGLITTKVGIGSFVTFNNQTINDALGWSRALADIGADIETRILRFDVIEDEDLAGKLETQSARFLALDRVRSLAGSGMPISIERSRVVLYPELEDILSRGLVDGSLSKTLANAGLVPDSGKEWVDIEMLGEVDAKILQRPVRNAFLRTRRHTFTSNNQSLEYVTSLLDPERFALHLEF
jgi:GntR family transcriptional regulator